jgi:PmbA protein
MKTSEEKDIIEKLQKAVQQKKIDAWKLVRMDVSQENLYAGQNGVLENILASKRKDRQVTLYAYDEKTTAEFTFMVSDDIDKQLKDAIACLKHVDNESYTVPKPQEAYNKRLRLIDSRIAKGLKRNNLQKTTRRILGAISRNIQRQKGVALSLCELHSILKDTHVKNSEGIDVQSSSTAVSVLLIVTASSAGKEQEYVYARTCASLKELQADEIAKECAMMVKDIVAAEAPASFKGPVVLCKKALAEFMNPHLGLSPIVGHASAKLAYMQLSKYKEGKPVVDAKSEALTIISNPAIPMNPSSSICDADGIPSKIVTLVHEGNFHEFFSSVRYAQYMKKEPTGSLGVIQVGCGKNKETALCKGDRIEIVEFASFVPNTISGDFSAEVRLGYIYKGKKKIPFRGGMFTGNVFTLFEDVYFSQESMMLEGYFGPKAMKFMKGTIAGME